MGGQGEREGAEGVGTQTQKKGVWARRVGARRVGARRVGSPKFRAFFSLSCRKISFFSYLSGVFSWNFGGVLKTKTLKCARVEFSGCRVRAPEARSGGAAGVSHDSPRAQTCTFEGLGLQNTTKIPRENTREGRKERNFAAGEGKKRVKFWAVQAGGGPNQGVVRRRAVRTRSGANREEGSVGPNWPGPTKIGLATQNQQGHGPNRARQRGWPKLVQIGSA